MVKKKPATPSGATEQPSSTASTSSLIICRNKHWRYISCFHGPWLHLPIELLESLAHQNWTMPSPRLIDPAVFFDVLKIRKYVDEAAHDSVRASTGISNNAMSGRMDYFGAGGGPGSQLSKERIFKIRQKAVDLLSKAFVLDEVAASVATMQAASTVEDVAQHVLRREPANNAAKYVHFFQEKVPSRAMEQHTSVQPLTEILLTLPLEERVAPMRTRALVQSFKAQFENAAKDFTTAIRLVDDLKRLHKPDQQQLELASKMRAQQEAWQKGFKDRRNAPRLKEEDQPKSLEMQLLFHRAGVYLTLAIASVNDALDGQKESQAAGEGSHVNGAETAAAQGARLAARKRVKTNAKRALKDYMAFLSHFEYAPGLPYEVTNEVMRRIYDLARGRRNGVVPLTQHVLEIEASDDENPLGKTNALIRRERPRQDAFEKDEDGWPKFPMPKIYPASMLFAERPPPDLPAYPVEEVLGTCSREVVTYHPLLIEALHSLLLAHALLQTSATECQRHGHNVARLTRIADGYPIFQSARSPARSDWQEVLTETKNWLTFTTSWQTLCDPVPLPDAAGGWTVNGKRRAGEAQRQKLAAQNAEQVRQRSKQESILEALSDERVVDEDTFVKAVSAREERAMQREESTSDKLCEDAAAVPAECKKDHSIKKEPQPVSKGRAENPNGAAYPLLSQRAQAIVRWIREAPASMGVRKKRPARKRKPTEHFDGANALAESVSTLSVDHDNDDDDDVD